MNPKEKIEQLASQILLHKRKYYQGNALISDAAYDSLEGQLRHLSPNHPVLSQVGYIFGDNNDKKIAHNPPMLSLDKTYKAQDIFELSQKYPLICTDKFDGMAMSLEYNSDGVLFLASTRGNGIQGENATEYIYHVLKIPKKIALDKLTSDMVLEIRGEIFFPKSAFAGFTNEFESYRNAVPGTFGRKDKEAAIPVLNVLNFFAYDVLIKKPGTNTQIGAQELIEILDLNCPSFLLKQKKLESLGFFAGIDSKIVEVVAAKTPEELDNYIEKRFSQERDYLIDGLVFRIDDDIAWEQLGFTNHHPRGSLAFKQQSETAITEILAIEENIGRSGKITFRARLAPVELSGAKISFASLHNAEFIENGGYAPGALVKITRSGEVIPSIIGLHQASATTYELPTKCPCGFPLLKSGPDLICQEKGECAYKDHELLVYFVQTLEINGVSDKIVLKMRESGLVKDPSDLFKLTAEDLLQLEGFAKKSAENTINAIKSKRDIPLDKLLTAIGLKRGGAVKCKEVAKLFRKLDAVLALKTEDLANLKGWGEKSADDFVTSLASKKPLIFRIQQEANIVDLEEENNVQASNGILQNKNICITGSLSKTRDDYCKLIESLGGKVVDSVSNKTSLLICNEKSNSSKYTKAIKLGIQVVDEQNFLDLINSSEK